MHLPQVRFERAPLDLEADHVLRYSRDERWKGVMQRTFPALAAYLADIDDDRVALAECRTFVAQQRDTDAAEIVMAEKRIPERWAAVGDAFLIALSEHFETDWPDERDITGYISILPILPRFLDAWSFCVNYYRPKLEVELIAHEILHFLWFKKWAETFPDMPRFEYESPHLAWRLSEVMDPVILAGHPTIRDLIMPTLRGYSSFEKASIGSETVFGYFSRIYAESLKRGDRFDEILRIAWAEANVHRAALEAF